MRSLRTKIMFLKKLNFLMFMDYFAVLMLKINFKKLKKYIIVMYF